MTCWRIEDDTLVKLSEFQLKNIDLSVSKVSIHSDCVIARSSDNGNSLCMISLETGEIIDTILTSLTTTCIVSLTKINDDRVAVCGGQGELQMAIDDMQPCPITKYRFNRYNDHTYLKQLIPLKDGHVLVIQRDQQAFISRPENYCNPVADNINSRTWGAISLVVLVSRGCLSLDIAQHILSFVTSGYESEHALANIKSANQSLLHNADEMIKHHRTKPDPDFTIWHFENPIYHPPQFFKPKQIPWIKAHDNRPVTPDNNT